MLSAIALWMELPAASVWIFISIYFFLSILAFRHVCLTLSTVPSHYVNISGTFTSWFMFSCVFAHTIDTTTNSSPVSMWRWDPISKVFICICATHSHNRIHVSRMPYGTSSLWCVWCQSRKLKKKIRTDTDCRRIEASKAPNQCTAPGANTQYISLYSIHNIYIPFDLDFNFTQWLWHMLWAQLWFLVRYYSIWA